jgi:hypothetical protein
LKHKVVEVKELRWGFDGESPTVLVGGLKGRWPRSEKVDPCPAYTHGVQYTEMVLKQVTEKFDIEFPVQINIVHYETIGRTNGHMSYDAIYEEDGDKDTLPRKFSPYIVLSGKRIPLHPAMTRYLVAHEYGHVVEKWINYKRGVDSDSVTDAESTLFKEYCELRGIKNTTHYGPGTWHLQMGEIFANDFRVVVCGIENEFWPHEVIYPVLDKAVTDWWADAVKKYAVKADNEA